MKLKNFLMIAMLLVATGLAAGCHYGSSDSYRYGSGYRTGDRDTYRDGFRDGRAYERRNENWRDNRYADRDYWRRRW